MLKEQCLDIDKPLIFLSVGRNMREKPRKTSTTAFIQIDGLFYQSTLPGPIMNRIKRLAKIYDFAVHCFDFKN